jgi:hypothetical protein
MIDENIKCHLLENKKSKQKKLKNFMRCRDIEHQCKNVTKCEHGIHSCYSIFLESLNNKG